LGWQKTPRQAMAYATHHPFPDGTNHGAPERGVLCRGWVCAMLANLAWQV